MDYQRDYIMRLIYMMGDLMRRICELLDNKERERMLDKACHEHCGMSLEAAERLRAESLVALLQPMARFVLSELLDAKAEACGLPEDEAAALRHKALRLLASLYAESQLCTLRADKLKRLKQAVFPLLTDADLMSCARFFEQAAQYDEMEDALFQALPTATGDAWERDREEAIAMLRAASRADEQTLILCRMTGSELRESAHEMEQKNR
jgi:hypothetical protein